VRSKRGAYTRIPDEAPGRPRRIHCMWRQRVLQVVKLNSSPSRDSDGTYIMTRRPETLFQTHVCTGGVLASELPHSHQTRDHREILLQSKV
jgi:hypothetical protein